MEVVMTLGLVSRVWYTTGGIRVWTRRDRKAFVQAMSVDKTNEPHDNDDYDNDHV